MVFEDCILIGINPSPFESDWLWRKHFVPVTKHMIVYAILFTVSFFTIRKAGSCLIRNMCAAAIVFILKQINLLLLRLTDDLQTIELS